MPWSVLALMGEQRPFQDVHTVCAGMRVQRVDCSGRVADQADFHARTGIHDQVLAIERAAYLLVGPLLPGEGVAVDGCELYIRHLPIMPRLAARPIRPKKKPGALGRVDNDTTEALTRARLGENQQAAIVTVDILLY
jgi:hypothetical protein